MTFKSPKEEIGVLLDEGKDAVKTVIQTLTNANTTNNPSVGFFKQNDQERKINNNSIKAQAEKTDDTISGISKELGITITATNSASLGLGTSGSNNNE